MITKVKSPKHHKKHRQSQRSSAINVEKPQVPLCKKTPRTSEKLEDWIDAS